MIMQLEEFTLWILFILIIGISLSVDLGIINKIINKFSKSKNSIITERLSFKQSLIRSTVWISLAGLFSIIIFFTLGENKTIEFLTGYVLEESLSVDNMMLFLLVFTTLGIPHKYQYKVLSVGILSAIVMRIIVILIGTSLLDTFSWMIYVFGGILLLSALRMTFQRKNQKLDLKKNISIKLLQKIIPIKMEITNNKFFVRVNGLLYATPLLVALIVIEMTDLVFAMDSIPAVLAVTTDPFIVITSNIFAIIGLRSLYFLISSLIQKLHYLKSGLIVILFFIGLKMMISNFYEIPTYTSFITVLLILGVVMILSIIKTSRMGKN